MDLGIEVILEMFSKDGLESLFQVSGSLPVRLSEVEVPQSDSAD